MEHIHFRTNTLITTRRGEILSFFHNKETEMEKTIKIGDKEILLKATAMNLLIYSEEFGEDLFKAKGDFSMPSRETISNMERFLP